MKLYYVALIAVGVLVLGFFSGMKFSEIRSNQQQRSFSRQFPQGMRNGQLQNGNGIRGNGRPVTGEVISSDDRSITVKSQDGSSKIVIITNSTQVSKTATASKTDITIGKTVGVFGTENTDGSITAQTVQLDPTYRMATGSGIQR